MNDEILQARDFLAERTAGVDPRIAVVLGSGLGAFGDELEQRAQFPYREIPHWPASTAIGHAGKLVLGVLNGLPLVVLSGRAHLYEGNTPAQTVFGVRTLGRLGVRAFVFTNAAGGINPGYSQGALVLLSDHINLQGSNPLCGPNDDSFGPRFPDLSEAYSPRFRRIAQQTARQLGFEMPEGVYAAMLGPSYETPAEIRFLRTIGADLAGMSTVPEVIAANHMGLECMAISCVTNMAAGILPRKINHEEVLETGRQVRGRLTGFLKAVLPRLAEEIE